MTLSTVIGLPTQTLYPAKNGPIDKAPEVLTQLFSPNANKELFTILWTHHFVPVFRHGTNKDLVKNTERYKSNDARKPVTDWKRIA
ncbi:hypothetical protein CHS0354_034089, partial [Potamilus streckersoni]